MNIKDIMKEMDNKDRESFDRYVSGKLSPGDSIEITAATIDDLFHKLSKIMKKYTCELHLECYEDDTDNYVPLDDSSKIMGFINRDGYVSIVGSCNGKEKNLIEGGILKNRNELLLVINIVGGS